MVNKIAELAVVSPYGLRVRFADGAVGVHDCRALTGEAGDLFRPLHDPAYFGRVFLEAGAPTWPNGLDLCPDWLRGEMEAAGELTAAAAE